MAIKKTLIFNSRSNSMKLLDADGNKLQSVTPYKDGVTIDGIFFKYDNKKIYF